MDQIKSTVKTLNFRRANFQLFKELVGGSQWETKLRGKAAEQNWHQFKNVILGRRSSQFPRVRNQARKEGGHHGSVRTSQSN